MTVRWSTAALLALLALVQAQLWFGGGGKPHAMNLELQLNRQHAANDAARAELGMVKPDEILVQIAPRK